MKPTCPTSCPLKQRMNQHRESDAQIEEIQWTLEQLSPFGRRQALAHATFLYYRNKGLAKFSTWLEMLERRRVLYFIWGILVRLDYVMIKGRR